MITELVRHDRPSMILGVDPGNANVGWAVVERSTRIVHALGAIRTVQDKTVDTSTDYLTRAHRVAGELLRVALPWMADGLTIATEALLTFGKPQSIASNALPHGALAMLSAFYGLELTTAAPSAWQRAILGPAPKAPRRARGEPAPPKVRGKGRKTDHTELYKKIADYIRRRGLHDAVAELDALGGITAANHALDAVGIALHRASGCPVKTIAHGEP